MSKTKFKIGTDPELFVSDGHRIVSAHDLMPGTKDEPFHVPFGAIQVDGVSAEFNTIPAETEDQFVFNILKVRSRLEHIIQEKSVSYHLVSEPTAFFEQEYWDSLPDEVKVLGCTPDFNAYTGQQNDPPSTNEPFRTGAGHFHIGWTSFEDPHDPEHFETCMKVVRQLDQTLYPMSMLWDSDEKRRELYGKMGSFRPKSYGVEYRPLSNKYLSDERIIRFCYRTIIRSCELLFDEGIEIHDMNSEKFKNYRFEFPDFIDTRRRAA